MESKNHFAVTDAAFFQGSPWPKCPCEPAITIEWMSLATGILSQDLLRSIVSFALPPLPFKSSTSIASSTAKAGNPYYRPVNHPGGGAQGTQPLGSGLGESDLNWKLGTCRMHPSFDLPGARLAFKIPSR